MSSRLLTLLSPSPFFLPDLSPFSSPPTTNLHHLRIHLLHPARVPRSSSPFPLPVSPPVRRFPCLPCRRSFASLLFRPPLNLSPQLTIRVLTFRYRLLHLSVSFSRAPPISPRSFHLRLASPSSFIAFVPAPLVRLALSIRYSRRRRSTILRHAENHPSSKCDLRLILSLRSFPLLVRFILRSFLLPTFQANSLRKLTLD